MMDTDNYTYSVDYATTMTTNADDTVWVSYTPDGTMVFHPVHPIDNIELNIVVGEDEEDGRLRPLVTLGDALDRLED